jgi:hypothetical protein
VRGIGRVLRGEGPEENPPTQIHGEGVAEIPK